MLIRVAQLQGFTLVELMVALAIAALLGILALPVYTTWLADAQIRSAAETIAGGLRYAQAQAIKHNEPVQFTLDPTTGTGGWTAQVVNNPAEQLQSGTFKEGAGNAQVAVAEDAGATTLTFSGLGMIVPNAGNDVAVVNVTSPVAGSRPLRVLVGHGRSGIKICDPAWPDTDPKGCPTAVGP